MCWVAPPVLVQDQSRMLPEIRALLLPSAKRHPSQEIRRLCIEVIHLLVVNRAERTYLRNIQIVRNLGWGVM